MTTYFPEAIAVEDDDTPGSFPLQTTDGDGHPTLVQVVNVIGPADADGVRPGPVTVTDKHYRRNLRPLGWQVHDDAKKGGR